MAPTKRVVVTLLAAALGVGLVTGGATAFLRPDNLPEGGELGMEEPPATAKPIKRYAFSKVDVDLAKLPEGVAPVPYWSGEMTSIQDPGDSGGSTNTKPPVTFTQVAGGYVVGAGRDRTELILYTDRGAQRLGDGNVEGTAVDNGGKRFAWTRSLSDQSPSTLVITDTRTGKPKHEIPLKFHTDPAIGFLGDSVVVTDNKTQKPYAVSMEDEKVRPVPGAAATTASPRGNLLAVAPEPPADNSDGWCFEIRKGLTTKSVWRNCDWTPVTFSPDGRFVVTLPALTDGIGPSAMRVYDLATGKPVLQVRATIVNQAAWSPDGDQVAFDVYAKGRTGLITCEIGGKCKRFTEPEKAQDPTEEKKAYLLPLM